MIVQGRAVRLRIVNLGYVAELPVDVVERGHALGNGYRRGDDLIMCNTVLQGIT